MYQTPPILSKTFPNPLNQTAMSDICHPITASVPFVKFYWMSDLFTGRSPEGNNINARDMSSNYLSAVHKRISPLKLPIETTNLKKNLAVNLDQEEDLLIVLPASARELGLTSEVPEGDGCLWALGVGGSPQQAQWLHPCTPFQERDSSVFSREVQLLRGFQVDYAACGKVRISGKETAATVVRNTQLLANTSNHKSESKLQNALGNICFVAAALLCLSVNNQQKHLASIVKTFQNDPNRPSALTLKLEPLFSPAFAMGAQGRYKLSMADMMKVIYFFISNFRSDILSAESYIWKEILDMIGGQVNPMHVTDMSPLNTVTIRSSSNRERASELDRITQYSREKLDKMGEFLGDTLDKEFPVKREKWPFANVLTYKVDYQVREKSHDPDLYEDKQGRATFLDRPEKHALSDAEEERPKKQRKLNSLPGDNRLTPILLPATPVSSPRPILSFLSSAPLPMDTESPTKNQSSFRPHTPQDVHTREREEATQLQTLLQRVNLDETPSATDPLLLAPVKSWDIHTVFDNIQTSVQEPLAEEVMNQDTRGQDAATVLNCSTNEQEHSASIGTQGGDIVDGSQTEVEAEGSGAQSVEEVDAQGEMEDDHASNMEQDVPGTLGEEGNILGTEEDSLTPAPEEEVDQLAKDSISTHNRTGGTPSAKSQSEEVSKDLNNTEEGSSSSSDEEESLSDQDGDLDTTVAKGAAAAGMKQTDRRKSKPELFIAGPKDPSGKKAKCPCKGGKKPPKKDKKDATQMTKWKRNLVGDINHLSSIQSVVDLRSILPKDSSSAWEDPVDHAVFKPKLSLENSEFEKQLRAVSLFLPRVPLTYKACLSATPVTKVSTNKLSGKGKTTASDLKTKWTAAEALNRQPLSPHFWGRRLWEMCLILDSNQRYPWMIRLICVAMQVTVLCRPDFAQLKGEYKIVRILRRLSGFGWDERKQCVTAPLEVWDKWEVWDKYQIV
ncbi:hypothetical protein K439DRAFT_1622777 [Ramaria rubella]|nr:hypothetical protein K439DRAFT_1622777 [Ramaria rubella]